MRVKTKLAKKAAPALIRKIGARELAKAVHPDRLLMKKIERNLRPHFPHDTVDVSSGHHDNIHVVVVSRKFDNMSEKRKQEYLWELITT